MEIQATPFTSMLEACCSILHSNLVILHQKEAKHIQGTQIGHNTHFMTYDTEAYWDVHGKAAKLIVTSMRAIVCSLTPFYVQHTVSCMPMPFYSTTYAGRLHSCEMLLLCSHAVQHHNQCVFQCTHTLRWQLHICLKHTLRWQLHICLKH